MPSSPSASKGRPRGLRGQGELALIERIRGMASVRVGKSPSLRLGIGDDCAILAPPAGHEMVVTTDMSLETRHFRRDWHPAKSVGHRTLVRGLSDLAAMGALPMAAFLSIALPSEAVVSGWIDGFLDGLFAEARRWRVPLAGGDTSGSPTDQVLADIVLLGSAPAGKALRRSGSRPGDLIYVTGALGGAAAELDCLSAAAATRRGRSRRSKAVGDHPHLYPEPRLKVGAALLKRGLATACIDVSDGLSTDLLHLCEASRVAAVIDQEALPIHPLAQRLGPAAALQKALHGGEDYELLFTAPAGIRVPRSIASVPVSCIGRIRRKRAHQPTLTLLQAGRAVELRAAGWEHLR